MKTDASHDPIAADASGGSAVIVALTDDHPDDGLGELQRARAFAEPLLTGQLLDTGEATLAHADGVAAILESIGAAPSMRAAAYLVYAGDHLQPPAETVAKAFGESHASLVMHTRKLVQIQRAARSAQVGVELRAQQTERVRKMLLAFSQDLRVVLLRLASRLQTLRFHAASKTTCPVELARESMQVFAPLANRLGIWQIKWEIEDLAFRFMQPADYHAVARMLAERRVERERSVEQFRCELAELLNRQGLSAEVQGRPKHLYSIWKKMQGKALDIDHVFDLRATRVLVGDVADCYAVLGRVHGRYTPVESEFDDYIAKPKPNGYQSLHTVVLDDTGRAVEVQIRTVEMHAHAEHGIAAHWAYKEAGSKAYAGTSALAQTDAELTEARKAVLRELLAWERDLSDQEGASGATHAAVSDPRIYVFTPQAAVVDLPAGATPLDFAYALHTTLGHRCRGAKVDGVLVPLNRPLSSGQTVEIVSGREGGPSLDWLNPELGYLHSPRARAKVRTWFNAQQQAQTIARGRDAVEKLLQREGKTSLKLDDLAHQLGFRHADALFEVVGKDEFSLRNIENLLRPAEPLPTPDEVIASKRPMRDDGPPEGSGVLVVGVESLMTSLSRCCRPAPPDPIGGYVTRGRGVAIHRLDCSNFRDMRARAPERVISVTWGRGERNRPKDGKPRLYPVDVIVEATDRQGLLRDISELLAKQQMNVSGVHTQSMKGQAVGTAWMTFTLEIADSSRLNQVLAEVCKIPGVRAARRR
ncbi:RelA/SpoT family protein [Piscinibacter sakaiensis]|uniref:RelA/SpoT family protein n=1 Tax=Piscinibacter sakaiensis TaxID=1547922 RepID=UPI003AB0E484